MKNFSIKVLLVGAVAVGLGAVVPAHAMDMESMRSGATSMAMQAREIAMLGKEEATKRLERAASLVIKDVRSFVKCAKGEQGCTGRQKAVLTAAVAGLVVAATALTLAGSKKAGQTRIGQKYGLGKPAAMAESGAAYATGKASAAGQYLGSTRAGKYVKGQYQSYQDTRAAGMLEQRKQQAETLRSIGQNIRLDAYSSKNPATKTFVPGQDLDLP